METAGILLYTHFEATMITAPTTASFCPSILPLKTFNGFSWADHL